MGMVCATRAIGRLLRAVSGVLFAGLLAGFQTPFAAGAEAEAEPIRIGLDADFSGAAAPGAIALRRGAEAAMAEINARGGVLGRPLALAVTDHRSNPRRGVRNLRGMIRGRGIVALLTGVHSPVALAQLEVAAEEGVVLLSPWAAATPIVSNGLEPNPAFRVSVRDEYAARFFVDTIAARGMSRVAMLLENTPWGVSNRAGFAAAARSHPEVSLVAEGWFAFGDVQVAGAVARVMAADPDVIVLVAHPVEAAAVLRALSAASLERRPAVIAHWGVTAGDFVAVSQGLAAVMDVSVLQTHSFYAPADPAAAAVFFETSCALFGICGADDVVSHTGMAHAYDAVHLIAQGLEQAGSDDPEALRAALERLSPHQGLVRRYDPPFEPGRHEALDIDDLRLARYDPFGRLRPIEPPAPPLHTGDAPPAPAPQAGTAR